MGAGTASTEGRSSLHGRMIAGKYSVRERLGGGAMGEVYRARQVALERDVAVKVIHPRLARDPEFSERFQREALTTSGFSHPNSIAVTDYGEEADGLLYLVMELVPGKSLEQLVIDDGPLPEARAVEILSQMLAAMAAAHDMGIVHRDLKPDNVLVLERLDDDGREGVLVKVCDFGIASLAGALPGEGEGADRSAAQGPRVTDVGTVVGTPAYMSPEQARGEPATARSDIYSAGVVMYQMLTGRLPFEGADVTTTVLMQLTHAPKPPRTYRPGLSGGLEGVCLRALEKAPERRFPSARAMRAALREASLAPLGGAASLPPPMVTAGTFAREAQAKADARNAETEVHGVAAAPGRSRWLAGSGAAMVVIALGGYFAWKGRSTAPAPPASASEGPAPTASSSGPLASVPAVTRGGPQPVVGARANRTDKAPRPHEGSPPAPTPLPVASATASAAAPATVAAAPSTPPAARPSPAHLRASVVSVAAVSRAPVSALVARAAVDGCFSGALSANEMTHGTAHLDIDEDGVVRAVDVRLPAPMRSAAACVRARLVGKRLPQPPDTGGASAELDLAPDAD